MTISASSGWYWGHYIAAKWPHTIPDLVGCEAGGAFLSVQTVVRFWNPRFNPKMHKDTGSLTRKG